MKIKTRIIAGYGLFIVVLVGLAAYQIVTVHQMQSINENLKDKNFKNAYNLFLAWQDLLNVNEFTEKYLQVADPRYKEQLEDFIRTFDNDLDNLRSDSGSDLESKEVERLQQMWNLFKDDLDQELQKMPVDGFPELPTSILGDIETLLSQARSVYGAMMSNMASKLDESAQTSHTAQVVLISVTVLVLTVTIFVSLMIVRSISKPLSHLTEGTRAITEGKYFYRLDTSRKDEFSQLAKDFNTMIRRLSELDELKKDFISHVSHELKSPLASMRETVQLMIDRIPGPLTEKQQRLLELNLQSADRLTSMIRNLLDLSKIEAGTMEYELIPQDLVPLVRAAIAELEVRAEEKQVRIDVVLPDMPLEIKCDRDRILQVLLNLLGNAVKFSPEGGVVRVRLEAVSAVPETIPPVWRSLITVHRPPGCFGLLSVTDSGPGIVDADKNRIFQKFHQIKKGGKISGQGVGLGLAICRTIVLAHEGAIWVEDAPGGGSCFILLLSTELEEDVALRASQPI